MRHAVVVTTINPPTESIDRIAVGCAANGWEFYVAGDQSTPDSLYQVRGDLRFVGFKEQVDSRWQIASTTPPRTYGRKMFGYLEAMAGGADFIVDTDDDNWPLADFFGSRDDLSFALAEGGDCLSFIDAGWINVYRYFAPSATIWPRGLPLSAVARPFPLEAVASAPAQSLVFQGLAEGAPDLDAIHRLIFPGHEYFFDRLPPLQLLSGTYCPFNSQNTTWAAEAFVLMYLPTTCTFRLTDIYRSYVAQRILHEMASGVTFHHATVHQDRNLHSIISDFRNEVPGYTDDGQFMAGLSQLDLAGRSKAEMLRVCYRFAAEAGYVTPAEIDGVEAWIDDVTAVGAA